MKRANTREEIKPLIQLCKAGKLFHVQKWISDGKPVNAPPLPKKGARPRSPLQQAITSGFHSMVEILLDGGAEIENGERYNSLEHALNDREFEIAKLLVDRGAPADQVDMGVVFSTWNPEIMEYFIERGADIETGNPLASAFCSRIRTALRVYKKHRTQFRSLDEQANIALRYHAKRGNAKWVSLMIWAGADPYLPGAEEPWGDADPDWGHSAIELAILYDHDHLLEIKGMRLRSEHPRAPEVVRMACMSRSADRLGRLLELGFPPNDQSNGGSSHLEHVLTCMDFWSIGNQRNIDTRETREKIKMAHLLALHGAQWVPENTDRINSIRRVLLKLTPDYTAEIVWIMSEYGACSAAVLKDLLKTPTIKAHTAAHTKRIRELMTRLSEKEPAILDRQCSE